MFLEHDDVIVPLGRRSHRLCFALCLCAASLTLAAGAIGLLTLVAAHHTESDVGEGDIVGDLGSGSGLA